MNSTRLDLLCLGSAGDLDLVRGSADLESPGEHLHRLGGHPPAAARGLQALRRDRRQVQGGVAGAGDWCGAQSADMEDDEEGSR